MKQRYTILILTLLIPPVFTLTNNEDIQTSAVDAIQEVQKLKKPLDKNEKEKQVAQAIPPVSTITNNKDSQTSAVDATQEVQELQKPLDKDEREKQAVQAILTNFAGVAGSFFNIVAAPNDPQNVGNSIANMIHGMINIEVEAFKHAQLSLDADEETIREFVKELTKKLEKNLAKVVVTKMKMERT